MRIEKEIVKEVKEVVQFEPKVVSVYCPLHPPSFRVLAPPSTSFASSYFTGAQHGAAARIQATWPSVLLPLIHPRCSYIKCSHRTSFPFSHSLRVRQLPDPRTKSCCFIVAHLLHPKLASSIRILSSSPLYLESTLTPPLHRSRFLRIPCVFLGLAQITSVTTRHSTTTTTTTSSSILAIT